MTILDVCLKTGHDTLQENQHCRVVNIDVVIPTLPSDLNATTNLLRKLRIHNTDWDSLHRFCMGRNGAQNSIDELASTS